ncbi:MAG: TRAM domain-containing protein, partial [Blastocatellia bacterium]|nr:TRAM domain-containing protein [Blastocatellia bacterium]
FLKLQELQDRIQQTRYKRYLDRHLEVLVENKSARSDSDFSGHSRCHKVVNFPADESLLGKLVEVMITEVKPHSLYGNIVKVMH